MKERDLLEKYEKFLDDTNRIRDEHGHHIACIMDGSVDMFLATLTTDADSDPDLIVNIAARIRDGMISEDVRFATRDPDRATFAESERVIEVIARDVARLFFDSLGSPDETSIAGASLIAGIADRIRNVGYAGMRLKPGDIDRMARDIAKWFVTLSGPNAVANQTALEESDRERGEVIKRAMIALEGYGIPNDVGDPDPMNMLAARIAELAKKRTTWGPSPLIDVARVIRREKECADEIQRLIGECVQRNETINHLNEELRTAHNERMRLRRERDCHAACSRLDAAEIQKFRAWQMAATLSVGVDPAATGGDQTAHSFAVTGGPMVGNCSRCGVDLAALLARGVVGHACSRTIIDPNIPNFEPPIVGHKAESMHIDDPSAPVNLEIEATIASDELIAQVREGAKDLKTFARDTVIEQLVETSERWRLAWLAWRSWAEYICPSPHPAPADSFVVERDEATRRRIDRRIKDLAACVVDLKIDEHGDLVPSDPNAIPAALAKHLLGRCPRCDEPTQRGITNLVGNADGVCLACLAREAQPM